MMTSLTSTLELIASPEFRANVKERNDLLAAKEKQYLDETREIRELERARRDVAEKAAEDAKLARCGVPAVFLGLSLNDVRPIDPTVEYAVRKARAYVAKWGEMRSRGAGLVFYGRPGTGKTMTACCMVQELLAADVDSQYVALWDLLRIVKFANSFGGDEKKLERLCRVPFLVIDEIGVQSGTQYEENLLMQVVDSRVRDKLPTVFITNLAPRSAKEDNVNTLAKKIGARLFDRICDRSWFLPFRGESQRKGLPPIEELLGDE